MSKQMGVADFKYSRFKQDVNVLVDAYNNRTTTGDWGNILADPKACYDLVDTMKTTVASREAIDKVKQEPKHIAFTTKCGIILNALTSAKTGHQKSVQTKKDQELASNRAKAAAIHAANNAADH